MKLSTLSSMPSFALFGPGFSDDGWTLATGLDENRADPRVVFTPYESERPHVFGARTCEAIALDFDVAPTMLEPRLDHAGHADAVKTIRDAIAAGDVYQVNLTLRAQLQAIDGAVLLATLCRVEIPPFAAWVRLPDGREFVSASPELFFAVNERRVRVQPMKGTARPDETGLLESSEKDVCELAMITDLMRNDLVPVCEPGSVEVVNERRFLKLAYAVQAVSDVEGTLRPDLDALDVLRALHPGGSITGAPKRAAMKMIERLESSPRGAYCGSLGLVRGGQGVFSILIRTAERHDTGWSYGVGGGIVWDSSASGELAEARLKLGALR